MALAEGSSNSPHQNIAERASELSVDKVSSAEPDSTASTQNGHAPREVMPSWYYYSPPQPPSDAGEASRGDNGSREREVNTCSHFILISGNGEAFEPFSEHSTCNLHFKHQGIYKFQRNFTAHICSQ
jgi:hypothetical protein